MFTIVFFKV